jgi:molecular chaperone HscA
MDHAHEDISARLLKEQQVAARRVIQAIDAALAIDGALLLSESEMSNIVQTRDQLEGLIDTACAKSLKKSIKALEKESETYVAKRMNASVQQMLAGKQVDEVDL